MAVKYVKDFTFAPSPPRPTVRGYARGGHVTTPQPFKAGGGVTKYPGHVKAKPNLALKGAGVGDLKKSPDIKAAASRSEKSGGLKLAKGGAVATAKVPADKRTWNKNDAVSPGSPKRTPMGQGEKNKTAASNKFATKGRGTPPATKQSGDVERMSGYSDFKNGGRIKNLGHYAHGGKVAAEYEKKAGTPKTSDDGSTTEHGSGKAMAMGGLSRGTSKKKSAAIHAKSHKPKGPGIGAIASALAGQAGPSQGAGAPPGAAPGMGAPPGGQMGGMAPAAPPMGGGPPMMASGGGVKHVVVHHLHVSGQR